ncbi:hypothetical protein SALBM135S_05548 [Streptomyces alboniger]
MGVDALLAADPGVLGYASKRHPKLKLHLSVQGSATNAAALGFYQERYGISRAVLPRVLSLKQVNERLGQNLARAEIEIALRSLFERLPRLRLAVPAEDIPFKPGDTIQGMLELPVTW